MNEELNNDVVMENEETNFSLDNYEDIDDDGNPILGLVKAGAKAALIGYGGYKLTTGVIIPGGKKLIGMIKGLKKKKEEKQVVDGTAKEVNENKTDEE